MRQKKMASPLIWSAFGAFIVIACCIVACREDNLHYKLGPLPAPSFTATPLASNPNKIVVQSTTKGAFIWKWDFGNGSTAADETDTVVYPLKGDYMIKLTVFGRGGSDSTTQQVSIAQDIQGLNLVAGGDMSDPTDWTTLNTGGTETTVTFKDKSAVFTSNGDCNGGIYQAVQVEAGIQYKFSATVEGSGATNTWFEVYIGTAAPVKGQDYTTNKFVSLNTWSGCGGSPFNGDIASIGCSGDGTGKSGLISFATSGTVYLVIKAGCSGGSLGSGGITLSHVSLIKI